MYSDPHVHVCIHMCMYAYTCACMRTHVHVCVHMRLQVLIRVFILDVGMYVHVYHVCAVCAQRC